MPGARLKIWLLSDAHQDERCFFSRLVVVQKPMETFNDRGGERVHVIRTRPFSFPQTASVSPNNNNNRNRKLLYLFSLRGAIDNNIWIYCIDGHGRKLFVPFVIRYRFATTTRRFRDPRLLFLTGETNYGHRSLAFFRRDYYYYDCMHFRVSFFRWKLHEWLFF